MKSVIDYVALENNLTRDNDIKDMGIVKPAEFQEYLRNHSNHTQLGILFCNTEWPVNEYLAIPCQFSKNVSKTLVFYSIIYNTTELFYNIYATNNQEPQETHPIATSLKLSLDNAILNYFSIDSEGEGNLELSLNPEDPDVPKLRNIKKQQFPRSFSRFFIGVDMVTTTGALQFFVPYMVSIFFLTIFNCVYFRSALFVLFWI